MKTIYTLCIAGLAVTACKSPEPTKNTDPVAVQTVESVIKPIKGLEIAPQIFQVSATSASKIDLPNGGSIEFPANAFVDDAGNPVKGNVDIHWKEFHSLTDIMLSGIPMKYDSLGKTYDFVSGGMFDISATAGNKEVNLANGKKATVNVASIDDTPCYNFYELNEQTGDWSYKTTKPGAPIENKKAKNTEKPKAEKASKDFILDVEVNTSAFPELQSLPVIGWRVLDKISPADQKMLAQKQSVCTLKAGAKPGEYDLSVDMKTSKHSYRVKPYLISEARQETPKNTAELEKDYAEILAFQENVSSGKVIRSIEIANFGVYNWDKMMSRTNMKNVVASFNINDEKKKKMTSFFFICPEENLIVNWSESYGNTLSFDPGKKNCLVAILPDNTVLSAGNDQFLKTKTLSDGAPFEFKFKETGIVLKSGKEMASLLQKLI